jgi:hypothetical protein
MGKVTEQSRITRRPFRAASTTAEREQGQGGMTPDCVKIAYGTSVFGMLGLIIPSTAELTSIFQCVTAGVVCLTACVGFYWALKTRQKDK